MTELESIVSRAVDSYRKVFLVSSLVSCIMTILSVGWVWLALLIPMLVLSYFAGLFLVAEVLSRIIPRSIVLDDYKEDLIAEINSKLDSGELQAGSDELNEAMKNAGLKPLAVIHEKGPVFGRQFDRDLYEYVDAVEDGKIRRYTYVSQATLDKNGVVQVPSNSNFLVLDGSLYEYASKPEPKI